MLHFAVAIYRQVRIALQTRGGLQAPCLAIVFRRRGIPSANRRVHFSAVAAQAELREKGLHVRGNLPSLQHKLAGFRAEGRGESIV